MRVDVASLFNFDKNHVNGNITFLTNTVIIRDVTTSEVFHSQFNRIFACINVAEDVSFFAKKRLIF
jgi:hypothetical protein